MKGVILAGGLGTRLRPLTLVANKATLPVYDKPVIYHIIEYFKEADITNIMIVTGREHAGDLIGLLGSGIDLDVELTYRVQEKADGIAGALRLCKNFAGDDIITVMLGDNLLENGIVNQVKKYDNRYKGAAIVVKEVPDPERFGVVTLDGNKVTNIVEKPKVPESNLAAIGVYVYDNKVFDVIDGLTPSARGEYEITDVNKTYMEMGELRCEMIKGWWCDAGTIDSLYEATILMKELREKREK